jgi:hypothetical protein
MGLYSLESSANNAILEPCPAYSGMSLMYTIGTGGVLGWIPVGLQRSLGASLRGSRLRQRADICHSGNYETTEEANHAILLKLVQKHVMLNTIKGLG